MKGLLKIPSSQELEKAYTNLQSKLKINEETFGLYSQWARFDPRLAEILIGTLAKHWKNISPLLLHENLVKQPWPSSMGVILDFCQVVVSKSERKLFEKWKDLVLLEIPKENFGQYFIGLRAFGGHEMKKDSLLSLYPYLNWGYLGRDVLLKNAPLKISWIPLSLRKRRLKELKLSRVTVRSYREALENKVSQRQAQRDLKNSGLKNLGSTQAKIYFRKK